MVDIRSFICVLQKVVCHPIRLRFHVNSKAYILHLHPTPIKSLLYSLSLYILNHHISRLYSDSQSGFSLYIYFSIYNSLLIYYKKKFNFNFLYYNLILQLLNMFLLYRTEITKNEGETWKYNKYFYKIKLSLDVLNNPLAHGNCQKTECRWQWRNMNTSTTLAHLTWALSFLLSLIIDKINSKLYIYVASLSL